MLLAWHGTLLQSHKIVWRGVTTKLWMRVKKEEDKTLKRVEGEKELREEEMTGYLKGERGR